MSHKHDITEPGLETEEAKELELDEMSKPTRKISHPNIPVPDISESNNRYKKGENKDKEMINKKSDSNTSDIDLSTNILDIMNKPDVAVWNKTVLKRSIDGAKGLDIGPLDQNLSREDNNDIIDSANKNDVEDVLLSGTRVTDKVDLSKSKSKSVQAIKTKCFIF